MLDVHGRDVLAAMSEMGIEKDDDFEWLSQLRYYWEEENMVTRMINSMLKYGYEYLGKSVYCYMDINSPIKFVTELVCSCATLWVFLSRCTSTWSVDCPNIIVFVGDQKRDFSYEDRLPLNIFSKW